MEKVGTRIGAGLLAFLVVLLVSLGAVAQQAWADDTATTTSYDKTLAVSGVAQGDTVNAYKLISYDAGYHNMVVEGSFKAFLQAQEGNASKSDNELAEWFKGKSSEEVRQLLKTYVNNWGDAAGQYAKPAVAASKVGDGGNVSLTFNPGYYLVLPSTTGDNSKLYNPLSVFVEVKGDSSTLYAAGTQISDGVVATMKTADGPTIAKYVLRTDGTLKTTKTVAIGDTVTYAVKITFPGYDSMGNPEFVLHDTLSGAAYNAGSVKVYNATGDTTYGGDPVDGVVTATTGANGEQLFSIDYSKIHAAQDATKTVFVVYDATVQDSIVSSLDADNHYVGENSAYLSYRTSADASTTSKTAVSSADIYSYAVTIAKTNENGLSLNGAKFKIYEKNSDNPLSFVQKVDADGSAYYVRSTGSDAVTELAANSQVEIRGIDASREYIIEESVTPSGYYAPAGKFNLSLASAKNGEEHTGNLSNNSVVSAEQDADQSLIQTEVSGATYIVKVKNSTTPSLPTTGGMGTVIFAVVGVVIMAAAVTILVRRKRHQ